jgi:hypothetical protein
MLKWRGFITTELRGEGVLEKKATLQALKEAHWSLAAETFFLEYN